MRNWSSLEESTQFEPGSGGSSGCEWQKEWEDVEKVCRHLGGIPVELASSFTQLSFLSSVMFIYPLNYASHTSG